MTLVNSFATTACLLPSSALSISWNDCLRLRLCESRPKRKDSAPWTNVMFVNWSKCLMYCVTWLVHVIGQCNTPRASYSLIIEAMLR